MTFKNCHNEKIIILQIITSKIFQMKETIFDFVFFLSSSLPSFSFSENEVATGFVYVFHDETNIRYKVP